MLRIFVAAFILFQIFFECQSWGRSRPIRISHFSSSRNIEVYDNSESTNLAIEFPPVVGLRTLPHTSSVHSSRHEFKKKYGHCNVPVNYVCECYLKGLNEDGSDYHYVAKLGNWLRIQRLAKKDKRYRKLSPNREFLLQKLSNEGSLLWDASEMNALAKNKLKNDIEWLRNYKALLHYCDEYGHCNVPARQEYSCILYEPTSVTTTTTTTTTGETITTTDNDSNDNTVVPYKYCANLGSWLHTQKQAKKGQHKTIKLLPERERLLQSLVDQGLLVWDSSSKIKHMNDMTWYRHYAALLDYGVNQPYLDYNIPIRSWYECILPGLGKDGASYYYQHRLGHWLYEQKVLYKQNRLLTERKRILQKLVDQGMFQYPGNTD